MDVLRTDHTEDYILERTALPDENILKAPGKVVFEEQQPLVCPFLIHRLFYIGHSSDYSQVSIQTQSLALRALRKLKLQETQALALASS